MEYTLIFDILLKNSSVFEKTVENNINLLLI